MVEQFTPSDDGRRLNYTMTMSNPAVLAEPVTFNKYWLWIPGASVEPYGCEAEPANQPDRLLGSGRIGRARFLIPTGRRA